MTSQVTVRMARELKKASIRNEAPIWARLSEYALKPSIARRDINIGRIAQLTKDGDVVAFPGKVLGTGTIGHGITLFSFGISGRAAKKVEDAGGRLLTHSQIIEDRPTGKGVVLLG